MRRNSQWNSLILAASPESDACLVVVAVFKTAAPTLRAGG